MDKPQIPCLICDDVECEEYHCIKAPLEQELQALREAVRTVYGDSGLAEVEAKAAIAGEGDDETT